MTTKLFNDVFAVIMLFILIAPTMRYRSGKSTVKQALVHMVIAGAICFAIRLLIKLLFNL